MLHTCVIEAVAAIANGKLRFTCYQNQTESYQYDVNPNGQHVIDCRVHHDLKKALDYLLERGRVVADLYVDADNVVQNGSYKLA